MAWCLTAYLVVERERSDHRVTWRQLKRKLMVKGLKLPLPALERGRMAA
jgi:hypothetical protein